MTSPEDEKTRSANEDLVRAALGRISAGDLDGLFALVHDDLVFQLPYGPSFMPKQFDKAGFQMINTATFGPEGQFSRFSIEPTVFHAQADPDAVIAEYASDGEVTSTGKPYKNTYIGVFHMRDGLIDAWKEFHNTDVAREAFAKD